MTYGCETCLSTGKWTEPASLVDDPITTLCPACGGVTCPKCKWNYVFPLCPLSGWYKCARSDCSVVFGKDRKVITEEG
jgi:hypothetical protein